MKKQTEARLYAATTVLLWSTVAVAFKISLQYLSVWQMLFWASATSAAALGGFMVLRGRGGEILLSTRSDWLRSAGMGFLNPFVYYGILFQAYDLLPAQEAQPLNYTWPIMLALLSLLFMGQRIGAKSFLAIGVSFFGVLMIATQGDPLSFRFTHGLGAALALSSSLVWAAYWILNLKDRREGTLKLTLNFTCGTVYTGLFLWFRPESVWGPWPGMVGAIYTGLFEMGITFLLWLRALGLSRTTAQVGHLIYFSPFLSLLFIQFVLGESIRGTTVAGLLFIIAGVFFQEKLSETAPEKKIAHP